MPTEITTPAPAAAIDRLTLATDGVRGTEVAFVNYCGFGSCFADDAE